MKIYAGKIPYSKDGSLMEYPEEWKGIEWRENLPFEAEFTFVGFCRGRSSAGVTFKNASGATFNMFLTDLADLIALGRPINVVSDTWVVSKRGQNYGICLFRE